MRILQCHNYYQQAGGEDRVLAEEKALLERHGHAVEQYVLHNDAVEGHGKLALAARTLWSRTSREDVAGHVARFKPDVVHVHNTLPLMSPSIYGAARAGGAAVVQTLHNYRMVCPGAYCMRDGKPCELCVTKAVKWPAIQHKCYRGSAPATAAIVATLTIHGVLGTYRRNVDQFITCSEFARGKMIQAGFDPDTLTCKPNFLMEDLGVGAGNGGYVLYLGRLSPEKGIATLIEAWDHDGMDVPLRIIGTGPMKGQVEQLASRRSAVTYLGYCPWPDVADQMRNASLLAFPSVNYEGMPMTLLEAMQVGLPVLGSRLGAIPEIVLEGKTGRCFDAGEPVALRDAARELMSHPSALSAMRGDVRQHYERNYAPQQAYRQLMAVYDKALLRRHGASHRATADVQHTHEPAPVGLPVGETVR